MRTVLCSVLLSLASCATGAENYYNFSSLTYQEGSGYEFGDDDRGIATLEHYGLWNWGDVFAFYDSIHDINRDGSTYYTEIVPRYQLGSFDSLTGGADWRPSEYFAAASFERGGNGYKAHMVGLGSNWRVPGVVNFQTNLFLRDDRALSGTGVQLTTVWIAPFETGPLRWLFDGYIDIRNGEGAAKHDVLINPQFKLDLGHPFGLPDTIYAGVEFTHWVNKFGVDGIDESVLAPLLQVRYSF